MENLPSREESIQLLNKYIENENLRNHCYMVAVAMEAYAKDLGLNKNQIELWWTAGLLHDLDWEKYPDEHPNRAVNQILPEAGYPQDVLDAIKAHAPERTGKSPETEMERYLFACDEIAGFMNAVSLMRPNGFSDMKTKSVTKKLKDKRFAENVSREDIHHGAELIGKEMNEHLNFLINVFKNYNA